MALYTIQELQSRGARATRIAQKSAAHLIEASRNYSLNHTFDVFLSHSFKDADVILGLKRELEDFKFSVYVDWIVDKELERSMVTKDTAHLLRLRMQHCACLIFGTSENSPGSKWMPWELGYFDALKSKVAILPVTNQPDSSDNFYGQEYLGLYPYIVKSVVGSGGNTLWVHDNRSKYVSLRKWLDGVSPVPH
jgi:hypothetical protein